MSLRSIFKEFYGTEETAVKGKNSRNSKISTTVREVEKRGYKKIGVYKTGSDQLYSAVSRAKDAGYSVSGVKVDGSTILFKALEKPAKAAGRSSASRTKKVASARITVNKKIIPVSKWHEKGMRIWRGLPYFKTFNGVKYTLYDRYDSLEEDVGKGEAKDLAAQGRKVKLIFIENLEGEERLALYVAK